MFKKRKKILISLFLGAVFFLLSTQTTLADLENNLFYLSLNFQKIIKDFFSKFQIIKTEDPYKEKYFLLLEELARLRLALENLEDKKTDIATSTYQDKLMEVSVLKKGENGYFYISNFEKIKEGQLVLDRNRVLIGRVEKVFKNYSLVKSLLVGDWKFNLANFQGELLGLGTTLSNGFLEIKFAPLKTEIKDNELIITYGDDVFTSGFLVGFVDEVIVSKKEKRVIVRLLANFNSDKFFVLK